MASASVSVGRLPKSILSSIPERRLGEAAGGPLDERVVLDFMDELFTLAVASRMVSCDGDERT